jgi:hypothetical protein
MGALKDKLTTPDQRQNVIDEAGRILDAEVADKGGLSGMAIKAAYGVVKNVKPGFIPQVIDSLLEEFLDSVEKVQASAGEGIKASQAVRNNPGQLADNLLAVTDRRAAKAERPVIQSTYAKLRPSAKKHVESSVPRLAELLERLGE